MARSTFHLLFFHTTYIIRLAGRVILSEGSRPRNIVCAFHRCCKVSPTLHFLFKFPASAISVSPFPHFFPCTVLNLSDSSHPSDSSIICLCLGIFQWVINLSTSTSFGCRGKPEYPRKYPKRRWFKANHFYLGLMQLLIRSMIWLWLKEEFFFEVSLHLLPTLWKWCLSCHLTKGWHFCLCNASSVWHWSHSKVHAISLRQGLNVLSCDSGNMLLLNYDDIFMNSTILILHSRPFHWFCN